MEMFFCKMESLGKRRKLMKEDNLKPNTAKKMQIQGKDQGIHEEQKRKSQGLEKKELEASGKE